MSECHSAAFARALPEPQREESLRGYTCCRTPTKREREFESLRGTVQEKSSNGILLLNIFYKNC